MAPSGDTRSAFIFLLPTEDVSCPAFFCVAIVCGGDAAGVVVAVVGSFILPNVYYLNLGGTKK